MTPRTQLLRGLSAGPLGRPAGSLFKQARIFLTDNSVMNWAATAALVQTLSRIE